MKHGVEQGSRFSLAGLSLLLMLQRAPQVANLLRVGSLVLKPVATHLYRMLVPGAVAYSALNTMSRATVPYIEPANGSENPALAKAGEQFDWFLRVRSELALSAEDVTMSPHLPGLQAEEISLNFWRITGSPSASAVDGSPYRIRIEAWENPGDLESRSEAYFLELVVVPSDQGPTIQAQPSSRFVPWGDGFVLSVDAIGLGDLTYQWTLNEEPIAGANASSYTVPDAANADAGEYRVIVSDSTGSTTSDPATIAVSATPYQLWREANWGGADRFDEAVSGPDADPEYDATANAIEFTTGSNPTVRDAPLRPHARVEGDEIVLEVPIATEAQGEVQVLIESSPSTAAVAFTPLDPEEEGVSVETLADRVVARVRADRARLLRMQVSVD